MKTFAASPAWATGQSGRACNIFNPSARSGQLVPDYDPFEPGRPAHKTNWFDFAPNAGIAWRPNVETGFLRALLGDPEQATIRGGYALSYNQERIDRFTANSGANPGGTVGVTRDLGTGYPLLLPGESAPVLFSQRARLGPPAFPSSPVYPIAATTANSVNIFPQDRHLKTPRVHSYSVGVQRSIGRDMAMEVRYVGNQNLNTWAEENWNERSVFASGFFDEFKLAQRNITANIAANLANRGYAYTGAPGTSPLPIHLAYLNGRSDANNPAAYTSTNFTQPAFVNRFSALRPQVTNALDAIDTATFRANALTAGLPRNLIVMNPMVSSSNVVADENWTNYNSLQLELRRRLSKGLLVGANYTYGIKKTSNQPTLAYPRIEVDQSDDRNAPHAFKMNWDYEIPVGRGRRIGGDMHPVLDMILGNWQYSGAGVVKTDRYRIIGVKVEGMSVEDLAEGVQDPHREERRGQHRGVQLPGGHPAEHVGGVQRRSHDADRLQRRARRADRPLPPSIERRELHRDLPLRLQHAGHQPERPALLAVGHAPQEAFPARGRCELRADGRSAERVRHDQLQPRWVDCDNSGRDIPKPKPEQRRGHVPRDLGVHRHQHHVRSGRPDWPVGVASELVSTGSKGSFRGSRVH